MSDKIKRAATALIIQNDKILAVSRKNNPNDWGLPGGKIDTGETLEQAAIRELKEETGLVAINPKLVWQGDDGLGWDVATFAFEKWSGIILTPEECEQRGEG